MVSKIKRELIIHEIEEKWKENMEEVPNEELPRQILRNLKELSLIVLQIK